MRLNRYSFVKGATHEVEPNGVNIGTTQGVLRQLGAVQKVVLGSFVGLFCIK